MLNPFKQVLGQFPHNITLGLREGVIYSLNKSTHFGRKLSSLFSVTILPILVGIGIIFLAIIAINSSTKWAAMILVAVIAPSIILIVGNLKKIIIVTFIVDIGLGIDIALQNQGWHRGGPTGYMLSLTTPILILGYTLWIIEKKPKLRLPIGFTAAALLYVMMSAFSLHFTFNPQLSYFGLFLKVTAFLMFVYLINHVTTWADLHLIFKTIAICLLLEGFLMCLQYFTGTSFDFGGLITTAAIEDGEGGAGVTGTRVSGTLGRPGNAALYLNSMLALTVGAYLTEDLIDKRLAIAAISLGLIALVATSSRGGWASFALALIIIILNAIRTEIGRRKISVFIIGGVIVSIFLGQQIVARFSTVTEDNTREELGYMAYRIMEEYPFGIGDNNYDQVMDDQYAHPRWVGKKHRPPHNKYLVIQTELGPQGLIAFVLVIIISIWQVGRWLFQPNTVPPNLIILGSSVLGAMATHLLHNRSESFTGRPQVHLFWFIIVLAMVINNFIVESKKKDSAFNKIATGNAQLPISKPHPTGAKKNGIYLKN